jgi:hypothetical protein
MSTEPDGAVWRKTGSEKSPGTVHLHMKNSSNFE